MDGLGIASAIGLDLVLLIPDLFGFAWTKFIYMILKPLAAYN